MTVPRSSSRPRSPTARRPHVVVVLAMVLATCLAVGVSPPSASSAVDTGDPVVDWNRHATDALLDRAGQRPQEAVPHLAMVHGAIFDAVNAISGDRRGYLLDPAVGRGSDSVDAAVATAAHDVLVHLLPDQQALLDDTLGDALAGLPTGTSLDRGVAVGAAAAQAMIAARTADGRYGSFRFTASTAIGAWRPEPPSFASDPNAWLARVEPFLVRSAEQFMSGPPPRLRSGRWTRDYEEVRLLGRVDSTVRTDDQTDAARYWAENPPAIWSRVLRTLATDRDLSVVDDARLFAQAYLAAADSLITVWYSKGHWLFWRPITAIAAADDDGNRHTDPEAGWTPLLPTPPYPEHPSGHLGLSSAMVTTMQEVFGTDRIAWTDTTASGRTRSFTRLSDALDEAVGARIWSGIHFRTADEDSVRIGRQVVAWSNRQLFERRSHGRP